MANAENIDFSFSESEESEMEMTDGELLVEDEEEEVEEEEVKIFNRLGEVVNIEKNTRKITSKVPLIKRRGKRA